MDYFNCLKIVIFINSEISDFQKNCWCKINLNVEEVGLEFCILIKNENEDYNFEYTVFAKLDNFNKI